MRYDEEIGESRLVAHVNGRPVPLEAVRDTPTPPPNEETGWTPIAHAALYDEVRRAGLVPVQEAHVLTRDGARYFGIAEVIPAGLDMRPSDFVSVEQYQARMQQVGREFGIVVGWRNTHDRSFAASLVLGSRVFVCDNLAFSGEVFLTRKHTKQILADLPGLVARALHRVGELRVSMEQRIQAYREHALDEVRANDIILRSFETGVVPATRIKDVLSKWRRPQQDEFQARNAWSLFNAFTAALGDRYGLDQIRWRTSRLQGLLDSSTGVVHRLQAQAEAEQRRIEEVIRAGQEPDQ